MTSSTLSAVGACISLTTRPSARKTTRSACAAASGSCVTMMIVCPSSETAWRRKSSRSVLARESRLPVGSSAKMISGVLARARACSDSLLLPAGELIGMVLEPVAETCDANDLGERRRVGFLAGDGERQHDVVERRQRRHEVEGLEDEANPHSPQHGELTVVEAPELDVADVDGSRGQPVESCEAMQQRRFAGAGRPHDGAELALAERNGDAVEGANHGVALAIFLDRIAGSSRGGARLGRRGRCPRGGDRRHWVPG